MQKWYNDGYFSSDLPMKRIRYDTQWTTVAELIQRTNGENIFLSFPTTLTPPTRASGSPSQIIPPLDHAINEPFQPAPIRSLRPSTLESYLSTGSLTSDSPSSSVGASHFGNPSPDPTAFGGKDSQSYLSSDLNGRLSAFGAQERPMAFTDRRTIALDSQAPPVTNMRGPSFGGFVSDRDLGFNAYPYNGVSIPHDSWGMSPNIPSAFIGARDQEADRSFSNSLPTELGPSHRPPEIVAAESLSRTYDQNVVFTNDDLGNFRSKRTAHGDLNILHYGHYDFSGSTSFQNIQDQPTEYASPAREYIDGSSSLYSLGQNVGSLPESSALPSIPTAPWSSIPDSSPSHHLGGQTEALQSITTISTASSSVPSQSLWHHVEQGSTIAQINDAGAQIALKEQSSSWKAEDTVNNLTAGNLRQHTQQQESFGEIATQKADGPAQSHPPPESVSDGLAPTFGLDVSKKATKALALQANHQMVQLAAGDSIVTPVVQKTAWIKEEEGKKKAGANVSVSLREIQEAEAKKLEVRKAAEREKERLARISASAEMKEDIQPFTTSWGLPTSQAGSRSSLPVRDAPVTAGSAPPAAPVWTTALKQPAVKKTMKEIQEEEEVRKKLASRENSPAVAPKRAYAETSTKVGVIIADCSTFVLIFTRPQQHHPSPLITLGRPSAQTASLLLLFPPKSGPLPSHLPLFQPLLLEQPPRLYRRLPRM